MILAIDIGNTRIKYAVFEQNTIIFSEVSSRENMKNAIENILQNYSKIDCLVVSSVGITEKSDFEMFSTLVKLFFVNHDILLPYYNSYTTPKTLGIDRVVLSAGAVLQFPDKNRLVIDAGTCVTYDFIDDKNVYHGGAISPGIKLRYESLHKYTAKLPLLTISEPEKTIGNSTQESIHSGVINGITFEINGFIESLKVDKDNFIIILTGGDAIFLANRLKNTIFANSNFLLESLNSLYQYQKKND